MDGWMDGCSLSVSVYISAVMNTDVVVRCAAVVAVLRLLATGRVLPCCHGEEQASEKGRNH